MTIDLEPVPVSMDQLPVVTDPVAQAGMVRVWATTQLMSLLEVLRPYVNGSLGMVVPQHVTAYVAAVKEVNRIWRVAYPVAIPVPVEADQATRPDPQVEAGIMRGRVLDQLRELQARPPGG